ncbi:MAG: cadherin-like beta sandwich domain-containing protein [Romboutsia timonensis]
MYTVTVTAEDGKTTKTYTIKVVRPNQVMLL